MYRFVSNRLFLNFMSGFFVCDQNERLGLPGGGVASFSLIFPVMTTIASPTTKKRLTFNYAFHAVIIVLALAFLVGSLWDGARCSSANNSAGCAEPMYFNLDSLRLVQFILTLSHGLFMLYGLMAKPSARVAWFLVCAACIDVAVRSMDFDHAIIPRTAAGINKVCRSAQHFSFLASQISVPAIFLGLR